MAQIARCAVAVVGQGFHDERNTRRAVPFVCNLLVVLLALSGFLEQTFNVVVRHIVGLRLCDQRCQTAVVVGIRTSLARRDSDLTANFCKYFGALAISFLLFAFDIRPFGMSGHIVQPFLFINSSSNGALKAAGYHTPLLLCRAAAQHGAGRHRACARQLIPAHWVTGALHRRAQLNIKNFLDVQRTRRLSRNKQLGLFPA